MFPIHLPSQKHSPRFEEQNDETSDLSISPVSKTLPLDFPQFDPQSKILKDDTGPYHPAQIHEYILQNTQFLSPRMFDCEMTSVAKYTFSGNDDSNPNGLHLFDPLFDASYPLVNSIEPGVGSLYTQQLSVDSPNSRPLNNTGSDQTVTCNSPDVPENDPMEESQHGQPFNITPWDMPTASAVDLLPNYPKISTFYVNQGPVEPKQIPGPIIKFSHDAEEKSSLEAQQAFNKLVPLLHIVNNGNFGAFLVRCLKVCHQDVSLDFLYNLLYNDDQDPENPASNGQHSYSNFLGVSEENLKGIKLCRLILESFRNPDTFQEGLFRGSLLPSINFHEVLRNFLALRIIFGCVTKVDDRSRCVPRLAVYKVYYILCHRLMHKYPTLANSLIFQENMILSQSKLGKAAKLVYPDISSKRLGRRGHSKSAYVGFVWNKALVDDDILSLIKLDLPAIKSYFKDTQVTNGHNRQRSGTISGDFPKKILKPAHVEKLSPLKPLYRYVDLLSAYPGPRSSPREWSTAANTIPKHSQWAEGVISKSIGVLEDHGINLGVLIENFRNAKFCEDGEDSLSNTVVRAMYVLANTSASKEIFLHLHLVVILLVFPVTLSSDQEICVALKHQFRVSMNACVSKVEKGFSSLPSVDQNSLNCFIRILRKLIHINEMTSCCVKYPRIVFNEMGRDTKSLGQTHEIPDQQLAFEAIIVRGIRIANRAFELNLESDDSTDGQRDSIETIHKFAKIIAQGLLRASGIMSVPDTTKEMSPDVPYQVFKIHAMIIHENVNACHEVARFPISVMEYLVLNFTNRMQNASLLKFGKNDPELCKETFKSWWVFSSMLQGYVSVISEVVALSHTLA